MIKKILVLLFSPFFINAQTAFISGVHKLCNNEKEVLIEIGFTGTPPFSFGYSIDGIYQTNHDDVLTPYFLSASKQGIYTITGFNDAVSVGTFDGSAEVILLTSPTAIINSEADTLSALYPVLWYNDISLGNIDTTIWIFGDDKSRDFSQSVYHKYLTDSNGLGIPNALYEDTLIVIDVNGCSDTAVHQVFIQDKYWMYLPNAFTPNQDLNNINEKFCFEYHSILEESFLFKVFNLQGELVFQSADALALSCSSVDGGWDGTDFRTQEKLSLGVYSYNLFFQEILGWKHNKYGTITLVR